MIHSFYKNLFYNNVERENGQDFKNMLRTYTRLRFIQNFKVRSTGPLLNAVVYVLHETELEDTNVLQSFTSH